MERQKGFLATFLQLNFAMLPVGKSGVLGRSITMWPPVVIGYRTILAGSFPFLFLKFKKIDLRIAKKHWFQIFRDGLLMGAH